MEPEGDARTEEPDGGHGGRYEQMTVVDAVVIGAGQNGLTAANLLVDAGWSVMVLEAQPEPGGAVRSRELFRPGTVHDLFSAFYPLAAASPHLRRLDLESHGLRWRRAPLVLAHPTSDGRAAVLSQDPDETAASLESFGPGDGDAWLELYALWERVEEHLLDALFTPFPPVRAGVGLARTLGPAGFERFLRHLLLPLRRMADERFTGEGAPLLLTGNGLHADFTPESAASGLFGWLLTCLGQRYGYPVPEGGAGALIAAMVDRLRARGGELVCNQRVRRVVVRQGRALGVETEAGDRVRARKAILADTGAPSLFLDLVGPDHLPDTLITDMRRRFQLDNATVKVDWLLRGPAPWSAPGARRAGTVHVGDSMNYFTRATGQLAEGLIPAHPALVVGQMNVADPTRSPAPSHTFWAYTKLPQGGIVGDAAGELTGSWSEREVDAFATRIEAEIERHAPGYRDLVEARHVLMPSDLEREDENLVGGAINGGTARIHQQLIFRPSPGLARPETPVERLYLASASAHPGGGVHGAPGANAAHAALLGSLRRRFLVGATRMVKQGP